MLIELRHLRFALAAADARSFARAAAHIGTKQATLSKAIAELEHCLGMALFERSTRGALPTPSGLAFLEVARRIVTDTDNIVTTARAVRYGDVGRLVLGYSGSLSAGPLRLLLGEFMQRFPDIQLDVVAAGPARLAAGLRSRAIDILVDSGGEDIAGSVRRQVWSERLMVATPHDHFLANRDTVCWRELRRFAIVLPASREGPAINDRITVRLRALGLKPNIIIQNTGAECILAMVPFNRFVTVVTESALGVGRPTLAFRPIDEILGPAQLEFFATWLESNRNPVLRKFHTSLNELSPG